MIVILKSQDGRREVSFVAVKGQHERNREFVRDENVFVHQLTLWQRQRGAI